MSLSKKYESASDAYGMARKHKHNLNKLFNECNSRADKKYRLLSPAFVPNLNKIENLGVGIRYDVNFKTAFKRQSVRETFFNGPISGVVLDGSFRKEFFDETIELYERASKIYGVRFKKHWASTGEEAGRVDQYIKSKIIK